MTRHHQGEPGSKCFEKIPKWLTKVASGWAVKETTAQVLICAQGSGLSRSTWPRNRPRVKSLWAGEEWKIKTWVHYVCEVDFCGIKKMPTGEYRWSMWILLNIKTICEGFTPGDLHERDNHRLKEYGHTMALRPRVLAAVFLSFLLAPSLHVSFIQRSLVSIAHIGWWYKIVKFYQQ